MEMLSVEATFIFIFALFKLRKMGKLSGKATSTFNDIYYFYICLIYIKVHFQGRGGGQYKTVNCNFVSFTLG